MTSTRIELLGDVAVTHDGQRRVLRGAQPRTVLTMLVNARRRSLSRNEIADALWPDPLPEHWSGAVRGVVAKVRAALTVEATTGGLELVTTQDGWRLDAGSDVEIDLEQAVTALERAEQLLGSRSVAALASAHEMAQRAAQSLSLPLSPGADGEWMEQLRGEVDQLARRAWVATARTALATGRHDEAVRAAEELRSRDAYDEVAVRLLLRAHLALGDRPHALRLLQDFGDQLRQELGVEPDPRTTAVVVAPDPEPLTKEPATTARSPFVGREEPMSRMVARWAQVAELRAAAAVWIRGEAGAGKTRLVEEFVGDVATRGARIRWGSCSGDAAMSYQPVLMMLPGSIEPYLKERTGSVSVETHLDRSMLFLQLADQLAGAVTEPTILVVDDVHWADDDTRALLGHLAEVLWDRPLLWVLTTRTRRGATDHLAGTFARRMPVDTIDLEGLDVEAVAELVRAARIDASTAVGPELQERTGGNPFFVEELIATVGADGSVTPSVVPESLVRWMELRVGELERDAADLLTAASVMGMQLDLAMLADVLERDIWGVLRQCEQLVDNRWLVEEPGGRLRFRHSLVRDAVDAGLGSARRTMLNARIARVLTSRPDVDPAALAEHLAAAGPDVEVEAVAAMTVAGDEALARSAWSAAADWYERAALRAARDHRAAARALIGLGRARRGLGDRTGGRAAFERSLALATSIGDARWAAAATLGLVGGGARGVSDALPDAERAALLRTALNALLTSGAASTGDDDLLVPLQLELALALLLTDHVDERRKLLDDALARARRTGRTDLLVEALIGSRMSLTSPDSDELRVRLTDEALHLSRSTGRVELELAAIMARHEDALLLGDRSLAVELLAEATASAQRHDHPYWRWVTATWAALALIIDGELDAAELSAFAALELQSEHPEALACLGVNLIDIRLFQGRAGEMLDLLRGAADDNPHIPCYRAVLALCLAEAGELDVARIEYGHFASVDFTNIPEDSNRLLALVVLADVAATLADDVGASSLLRLLEPHAHRQALLNCFAGGGAYWGPVATQLGRLCAVLGETDDAAHWFDLARRSAEEFGAPLAARRLPG